MDKENIKKHLKIIGIYKYSQLKKGSLDKYWKLRYYKIRNSTAEEQRKNDLLIRLNNSKRVLSHFTEEEIHSLLKGADKQIFERSSIINYPKDEYREWQPADNLFYSNGENIMEGNNYRTYQFPNIDSGQYWYIKNFVEFNKLLDDIKQIVRFGEDRTLEELIYLLSFIFEEKINLFIGKDIKKDGDLVTYGAYYIDNSIVINSEYIMDIDFMCETLTHELIHYLQSNENKLKPLKIDIEDSIVPEIVRIYPNNHNEHLRIELEAGTFDHYPNFIKKFKENKDQFRVSTQRDWTIDWICQNKKLPIYPSHSSSTEEIIFKFDFADG